MRKYFVCALLIVALCWMTAAAQSSETAPAKPAAPAAPMAEKAPAAKPAPAKPAPKVNINSASKADLVALGLDEATAQKVIDGRPYAMKSQLVSKKIVDKAMYGKISAKIIASGAKPAAKPKPAPAEKPKQ